MPAHRGCWDSPNIPCRASTTYQSFSCRNTAGSAPWHHPDISGIPPPCRGLSPMRQQSYWRSVRKVPRCISVQWVPAAFWRWPHRLCKYGAVRSQWCNWPPALSSCNTRPHLPAGKDSSPFPDTPWTGRRVYTSRWLSATNRRDETRCPLMTTFRTPDHDRNAMLHGRKGPTSCISQRGERGRHHPRAVEAGTNRSLSALSRGTARRSPSPHDSSQRCPICIYESRRLPAVHHHESRIPRPAPPTYA